MKQVNWYQIFGNTHTIPDGSTVTPTDDVQILLNCANIWNKAYTTISDLLSDTTSLLAVIVDNNAINYLVRSTTFASAVTADSTAMTDIGSNNYASNTLLADATWATAICNSEYFESVLNAKAPIMTSNTTPEGVAFASVTNSIAYYAFDGNSNTGWRSETTGTANIGRIGYKFTDPVEVRKIKHKTAVLENAVYQIQYSDDGVTWNTVSNSNYNTSNGVTVDKNIDSVGEHLYWAANHVSSVSTSRADARMLQFYGREDV